MFDMNAASSSHFSAVRGGLAARGRARSSRCR